MLAPMVAVGAIGAVILLGGLGLFLYYEPVDEKPQDTNARITGVFHYNPATHQRAGSPTARFTTRDVPAAVVDWQSLPADMTVSAHWYDDHGQDIGGVEPAPAGSQAAAPIPIDVPPKADIPAGVYVFVVERIAGGRSVQVLARSAIKVDGS